MSTTTEQEGTLKVQEHIHRLAVALGGRGSCSRNEQAAAEYCIEQMNALGIQNVRIEAFPGNPSTYRPYVLAISAALVGVFLSWADSGREWLALAASLSGLGAWGMLRQSDLAPNWTRRLIPSRPSHNAIGVIPAAIQARRRLVISAHVDTHRTPVFYSSPAWRKSFNSLVSLVFLSMAAGGAFYALGAFLGITWVRWLSLPAALVQLAALALCLHADRTPFSPGANDNAAGVGLALELGRRLVHEPMPLTEVWLLFTGCEETDASGMVAFLDAHAQQMGDDAVYLVLDEPGLGRPQYLTTDGLINKQPTHPRALELARRAAAALPETDVFPQIGIAYTDAIVATKRKLIALSIGCSPDRRAGQVSHWHQMSDTPENLDPRALADSLAFAWQVAREVDKM